jgi:uncharacterized DUF497 family protein
VGPGKAEAHAAKHGVSFDEAVTVFLDGDALDTRTCTTQRPKCGPYDWVEPQMGAY